MVAGRSSKRRSQQGRAADGRAGGRARADAALAGPQWSAAALAPDDGNPRAPVEGLAVSVLPRLERQSGGWTVDTGTRLRGVEERLMQLTVTYF
jgi:hypothetical protein